MTDVLTPPPDRSPDPAPAPPPIQLDPPAPPPTLPAAPPPPGRSRRAGRGFALGLLAGLALAGAAAGGIAIGRGAGTSTPAVASPVRPSGAVAPRASVHDLVVAARPSIASIHTTLTGSDIFGNAVEGQAAGTGFVLSADGYLVTNNHVVDGADSITVTLADGGDETAQLVAADPRSDLAVLHVDRTDLVPIPLGDSGAIQVGDPVVAIGNALDLGAEPTVTGGLISATGRTIPEPNGQVLVDLLQTDAAISPGNSGGPLLDLAGHVVGINTAVAGQGQNIGFAIAIDPAKQLIDELRNGQVPRHALLGVRTRPLTDGSPGAEVVAVDPGSGAGAGGVRTGDVITEIDTTAIADPQALIAAIAEHRPGDVVQVTVTRNGTAAELSVTLGAHDDSSS